jgi:hypothetical protein
LPFRLLWFVGLGRCDFQFPHHLSAHALRGLQHDFHFVGRCGSFAKPSRPIAANAVRLQLHALAYNLANFMRTLALPEAVKHWSLTSLRDKLVKIGAKIVNHARYVTFQMAEVAVPSQLFVASRLLERI